MCSTSLKLMKKTILSQKEERDKLLSFPYQQRYLLDTAIVFRDSHPIKLITGPRRAGKSVLALQMLQDKNFAYLNFDDSSLLDKFQEDSVEQALNEVYPGYEYLLLDEIQNLDGWNSWVSKLYRRGVNLIITGSNAKMLSTDLATILSGRHIDLKLFPFSAKEYLQHYNVPTDNLITPVQISTINIKLDDFLHNGGYPEVIDTPKVIGSYLSGLYDSIILKDIVKRYKVRKVQELYSVASWLLSNFTNPFSVTSLTEEVGMSSANTVKKFCGYLEEVYLFQYLSRLNNKLKLMAKADRKVYVVDNGFIEARAFELSQNLGRLLENLVFMELLKRGYDLKKHELFYYRSRNDRETDFVCRQKNNVEQLIQVCFDMSALKTRKSEVNAIVECAKELKCHKLTIITWNEEETIEANGETIRVIPLWKWCQE